MEAGSARIVESAIYDDHLFFFRLLACTRFQIVTPRPSTFRKKCRLGSKFTLRALLCAPSASFRFRLSYVKRPSRRSFARANSASFRRSKLIAETPNAGVALCSPFCLHKKSQLDVITTQRRQKNVAQLLAIAVPAELLSDDWSRLRRHFFGRSKLSTCRSTFPWRLCRLSFLKKKKKEGNITSESDIYTVCCIKNETTFVLENWHVTKNEPLLFGVHWPTVVILLWWHQQKTEECTSIGCSAKFLRGVWNFSLYKFSDFLEKRFCHCSLSCQIFCNQAICIHSLLHPQPNIFIWKMLGHIWCADTNDLLGQKFPTEDPAVCSLLLPLLWESGNECVGFSLQKWKVLPSPKF